MYLTPAWQKVKEENEAKEMAEKMRLEREDNLWRERMKQEAAEAAKVQDVEPKQDLIPQGPERQVARSGEHVLTMRSSQEGDAPQIYFVKKVGKESVSFRVLNGNSFAALQSAFNLFETNVEKIGSTKPADIKSMAE